MRKPFIGVATLAFGFALTQSAMAHDAAQDAAQDANRQAAKVAGGLGRTLAST